MKNKLSLKKLLESFLPKDESIVNAFQKDEYLNLLFKFEEEVKDLNIPPILEVIKRSIISCADKIENPAMIHHPESKGLWYIISNGEFISGKDYSKEGRVLIEKLLGFGFQEKGPRKESFRIVVSDKNISETSKDTAKGWYVLMMKMPYNIASEFKCLFERIEFKDRADAMRKLTKVKNLRLGAEIFKDFKNPAHDSPGVDENTLYKYEKVNSKYECFGEMNSYNHGEHTYSFRMRITKHSINK